jgi:hypothetical protein
MVMVSPMPAKADLTRVRPPDAAGPTVVSRRQIYLEALRDSLWIKVERKLDVGMTNLEELRGLLLGIYQLGVP